MAKIYGHKEESKIRSKSANFFASPDLYYFIPQRQLTLTPSSHPSTLASRHRVADLTIYSSRPRLLTIPCSRTRLLTLPLGKLSRPFHSFTQQRQSALTLCNLHSHGNQLPITRHTWSVQHHSTVGIRQPALTHLAASHPVQE
ncbi:hypothetical protein ACFE04_028188 [Oxalis oulophora]